MVFINDGSADPGGDGGAARPTTPAETIRAAETGEEGETPESVVTAALPPVWF